MQALLDHTARRILQTQVEVIKSLPQDKVENLTLIFKWGCDGSSGHSNYKQKYTDCHQSDSNIFLDPGYHYNLKVKIQKRTRKSSFGKIHGRLHPDFADPFTYSFCMKQPRSRLQKQTELTMK